MAQLEEEKVIIGENAASVSCWQRLIQDNRLSNIEIRIIEDASKSDQEIAVLYQELTTKEDQASVLEIMDKISQRLHLRNDDETEENSAQTSDSEVNQKNNPLLIDLVIECLFGFLPSNNILQCRLVNQKWNKEAESILHKRRVKIYLNSGEQCPSKFFNNSFLSDPQNPFNDFTFLPYNNGKWQLGELNHFFAIWGDKVVKLKFQNLVLDTQNCQCNPNGLCYQHAYKMEDWISRTPNLTHLDLNCEGGTTLVVNYNQLTEIKFLSLIYCHFDPGLDSARNATKIRPSYLSLEKVLFQMKDSLLGLARLNYFFDLDTATHINLSNNRINHRMCVLNFIVWNMSTHIYNTDMLICANVVIENWEHAEGNINYLYMKEIPLRCKTRLQIKQFYASTPNIVDLFLLPITVEKINVPLSKFIRSSEDEIELPNLTSVHFQVDYRGHDLEILNQFARFPSIVDLRFVVHQMPWILDMSMIPTSVKRVKIVTSEYLDFQKGRDMLRQLESLILENFVPRLKEVTEILKKVKTKVLVISWNGEGTLNTNEIVEFVLRVNQRVEKIIIGTIGDETDLHKNSPFEQSRFSVFVDQKKSNHYLFENEKATPLTLAKFEAWEKMDDAFDGIE